MDNIALGRYMPYDSLIHKLDPRAKIIALIIFMIAVFLPSNYPSYGVVALAIIAITLVSKLTFKYLLKSVKPMIFMMVFLLIINIFVIKEGTLLISLGFFSIYSQALHQTLFVVLRLMFIIMATTLLTATTKPLDLTMGIESLLKPLKTFHVPAEEISMIISIALRFIPTLIEETSRIMKAQASRGVELDEGKLIEKLKAVISMIVPLFASAFQRAIDLAYAMEARGYIPNQPRTKYRQLKITAGDVILIVCSIITLICVLVVNVYA